MEITVIITAHNRKQYLERAIKSVLNQTLGQDHFEIIVIKNFSEPKIDSLIKENGIISILSPSDSTVGYDLSHTIEISKGEIIAFLDDDDTFTPTKLEKLLYIFQNKDIGYIKNEIFFQNDEDLILSRSKRLEIEIDRKLDSVELTKKMAFLNKVKAGFNLSSISIKKEIIDEKILYFLRDHLVHSTDTFFFCCGLDSGKAIYLCSERLTGYRMNESTSKKLGDDSESIQRRITFWNNLISAYHEFSIFFGGTSREYLKTRTCSQKIAREIAKLNAGIKGSIDFSWKSCMFRALQTADSLLLYDLLRYLTAGLKQLFKSLLRSS